jgi:ATP-dependent DNA helicase 2 subunit 2
MNQEHAADKWNRFLYKLKEECTGSGGDKGFWNQVRSVGRELSLITQREAASRGDSNVTDVGAEEVCF